MKTALTSILGIAISAIATAAPAHPGHGPEADGAMGTLIVAALFAVGWMIALRRPRLR